MQQQDQEVIAQDLPDSITKPPILVETDQFVVKLAENADEVEQAQRLRYQIFNVEQGKGLKSAEEAGIDSDEFDDYCLHLLVREKATSRAIGTYRAHFGFVAKAEKGFYCSREYQIAGLDKIGENSLELGRSCVSSEFRSGTIVSLLWTAIVELLSRADLKYMMGCVSLEETDPRVGWAVYNYLCRKNAVSKDLNAVPQSGFTLERPGDPEIDAMFESNISIKKYLPALFTGYLRLGAQICGEPALDSEFGTIDFLILVDIKTVPQRYLDYFKYLANKT